MGSRHGNAHSAWPRIDVARMSSLLCSGLMLMPLGHRPGLPSRPPAIPSAAAVPLPPNKRFALLVGISDYPGSDEDLGGGPLNDVALMKNLLVTKLEFPEENIVMLTDAQATRANIIRAFLTHLGQAGKDGVAVFYYSGHGGQVKNTGDDPEPDGLDEVLVVRSSQEGKVSLLVDDELGVLAGLLQTDRVLFILDNCYSGTGTRGVARPLHWRDIGGDIPLPPSLLRPGSRPNTDGGKRIRMKALEAMPRESASSLAPSGGVLQEPQNHVLLAASSEHELSLNVPLKLSDGSEVRVGLFTATLYAAIMRSEPRTTSFSQPCLGNSANSRAHRPFYAARPANPAS
jgi:hypothetical protein